MIFSKRLSFQQLLYLSICGFGIQFASSLQMSNTSSLFNFLGATPGNVSYLWLAAPISGLLIQPLVGQFSDSTVTQYGKRNPYIFVWGILAFLSLCLLPFAYSLWFAASLMWIVGCSINGCTEALRALIGDITPNNQKPQAFAYQTIASGIGAGIAASLPWLLSHLFKTETNTLSHLTVPPSLRLSFAIGGIVLLVCVLWMLRKVKEKKFSRISLLISKRKVSRKRIMKNTLVALDELWMNIKRMPIVMRKFSIVQLFTWTGIFCMWSYFGIALAQHLYGLPLNANLESSDQYSKLLEQGTIWAGICFSAYQFVSVIYAFILPFLADKFSPKIVHAFSLIIGAVGLAACGFLYTPKAILISMLFVGIMWGSIMTLPYAIVSAELPRSKMGVYLGIFNITITVPQIISGLFLSFITSVIFRNHAMYTVVFGGILIFISGFILLYQDNSFGIRDYMQTIYSKLIHKNNIDYKEDPAIEKKPESINALN